MAVCCAEPNCGPCFGVPAAAAHPAELHVPGRLLTCSAQAQRSPCCVQSLRSLPTCSRPTHDLLLVAQGLADSHSAHAQVQGRTRLLLIPPEHAFRGAYAYPMHHPYDTYMMPDLEAPELQAWPGLQNVRGKAHMLSPGCSVFIPAYWYAYPAGQACRAYWGMPHLRRIWHSRSALPCTGAGHSNVRTGCMWLLHA